MNLCMENTVIQSQLSLHSGHLWDSLGKSPSVLNREVTYSEAHFSLLHAFIQITGKIGIVGIHHEQCVPNSGCPEEDAWHTGVVLLAQIRSFQFTMQAVACLFGGSLSIVVTAWACTRVTVSHAQIACVHSAGIPLECKHQPTVQVRKCYKWPTTPVQWPTLNTQRTEWHWR